jgi:hypothetical protein
VGIAGATTYRGAPPIATAGIVTCVGSRLAGKRST